MSTKYRCESCRDRGWIITPNQDLPGMASRCSCWQSDPRDALKRAGVPQRYLRCSLDGFAPGLSGGSEWEILFAAQRECRLYVENFIKADGCFEANGLLLFGPPGAGKTHLVVAVLYELFEKYGARPQFVDFPALIAAIQSTFDPDIALSKQGLLRPLQDAEVLVIDELGALRPSPFVTETLYLLINQRYKDRRPTLFTTNCVVDGARSESLDRGADSLDRLVRLSDRIPAMLISRLYEMAHLVDLSGARDYRREILMHSARAF